MVNTRVSSEFEPQSTTTSRTAMRYQHAARGRSAELAVALSRIAQGGHAHRGEWAARAKWSGRSDRLRRWSLSSVQRQCSRAERRRKAKVLAISTPTMSRKSFVKCVGM